MAGLIKNCRLPCRKRRKLFAMRKQARERMQAGGNSTADGDDIELFSLNSIKSKKVSSFFSRFGFLVNPVI